MKQKAISYWLKAVAILIGLLGLAFFGGAFAYGFFYKPDYEQPVPCYLRNNAIFLMTTAIICYLILFLFWKIITEIGNDNSFSMENVKNFKYMAICGVFLIIENIIRIITNYIKINLNLTPPESFGLIELSYTLLKILVFVIFVILCIAMSKLVQNAYEIKQENELTI